MSAEQPSPAASASAMPDQISVLKESIAGELAALTDLPLEDKNAKNEDINSMILYYTEESKAVEDRRNRMAEFAWQSLALAVTASAVIIALSIATFIKSMLLVILGAIIITHILQLFTLQVQYFYKHHFYLRLLKYDQYTPLIILVLVLVYVIVVLLLNYISPRFGGLN